MDGIDEGVKEVVKEKGEEVEMRIERMEVMGDDVEVLMSRKGRYGVDFVVKEVKGY